MSGVRFIRDAVAGGRATAATVAREVGRRLAVTAGLNATLHWQQELLDREAARVDAVPVGARGALPLAGVPVALKDNIVTTEQPTTCASRILEGYVSPFDATVVRRLRAAGAMIAAKTNLDEFAMGSSTEHSAWGRVLHPLDHARVPGGSSGGSAALVAAGVVPFATGSDTGGSVRQPAAFCGITGLKPTYGRVSRWGMVAFASSLDQAGVLARSAADCAQVLAVVAGHDPRDATSVDRPVDDYVGALAEGVAGRRIGVVRQYFGGGGEAGVAAAVRESLAVLERAGATLVDVDLPSLEDSIAAYYVIAPAEASSNLARYDGVRYGHRCADARDLAELYSRSRAEGFGAEVQRRILVGTYVLSAGYYDAYYGRAQRLRRLIAQDFARAFAGVDLLAGPTAPTTALALGSSDADPAALYAADVNTVAVNLAGLPAISVPAGFADGLPVGLQLVAPAFEESRLLAAGHALQQASDWHRATPAAHWYG